jgi:hypothetical protein
VHLQHLKDHKNFFHNLKDQFTGSGEVTAALDAVLPVALAKSKS